MPQWPQHAHNSILVSGIPLEFEYEASEAGIWPGMGVTINTSYNWKVDLCDTGDNIICVVDISMASLSGRGSWRYDSVHGYGTTTALPYNALDQMKCISGPITLMLLIADSQSITEGMKLKCVGAGMFGEYECQTTVVVAADPCALVAEAMEQITVNTIQQYCHAKLLI